MTPQPLILLKLALWLLVVVTATVLLRRRLVTPKVRTAFVIGGTLVFGFMFGQLIPGGQNPNPVASVRSLFQGLLVAERLVPLVGAMLLLLLLVSWVSNKAICGWGCQLGLLQDLLNRVPTIKWRPPFWLSNSVRIVSFLALVGGLAIVGLDWIGLIDPFALFTWDLTWAMALAVGIILLASLFVYRPWCHFCCPFGLLTWLLEQVSLMRPRINRDACKACQLCVRACPGHAMGDIFEGKALHGDCFACGACIEACPHADALGWRVKD